METEPLKGGYFTSLKDSLVSLHYSRGEIYLTILMIFFLKSLFNFVGFLLSIYYIEVWELDDSTAGILVALNSSQLLYVYIFGGVVDFIGVRDTYIIMSTIGIIAFAFMAFVQNLILHILIIIIVLQISATITFATLKSAVIFSTDTNNRSQGFSIYMSIVYISMIIFGLLTSLVFAIQGVSHDSFRTIFIVIIGFYVCSLLLAVFFSKLNKNWNDDMKVHKTNPLKIIKEAINEKRFWRLTAVLMIAGIPIGTLYQTGFALPIYMERELDDTSNYGIVIAVYSLLIIVLCPLFNPLVNYFSIYNCIIIGSLILGLAPTVFVVGSNYYTLVAYVILTAIGGAIAEGRITDYSGFAGVPGKEGIYVALASYSYSFGFIVTGIVGGQFLENFCPKDGEKNCWIMWLAISGVGLLGPFLLWILRRWIEQVHDLQDVDPYMISSHMN